MHTLDLEKTYRLKLLNLNNRIVKVNFKKLKDKVSNIESHLSADEITDLKVLESQGKLKAFTNAVNLSSALKIAGAAKRLKLQSQNRPKSAFVPRTVVTDESKPAPRLEAKSPNLVRSNSVTGAFIDAPGPNIRERRNSVDGQHTVHLRSLSAMNPQSEDSKSSHSALRALTSMTDKTHGARFLQTPKSSQPSHSPYSSHSAVEKKAKSGGATPREVKASFITDDSIDSNLGDDLYEERRQEMILEEELKYASLTDKKTEFMVKLNEYLSRNPQPVWHDNKQFVLPDSTEQKEDEDELGEEVTIKKPKKRLLPGRSRLSLTNSMTNEENYKMKMLDMWKDLKKCRYLRLPDEVIDISGVDTLAKSQVKLFQIMQKKNISA